MRLGFIGIGKMGGALVRGILRAGVCSADSIIVAKKFPEMLTQFVSSTGVQSATSNSAVAEAADAIILCVKPWDAQEAIKSCGSALDGKLLISIVTGLEVSRMEEWVGDRVRVVRTMPNTPVQVGAGVTAFCASERVTSQDIEWVHAIFGSVGQAVSVAEKLLNAVTGVSGSGPAYAFLAIEALSDGGVAAGLSRDLATKLAAHTLLGAAKMVLESGEHPAVLREAVTSPAGTTAAALAVLEDAAVRSAFREAVLAAANRSYELRA